MAIAVDDVRYIDGTVSRGATTGGRPVRGQAADALPSPLHRPTQRPLGAQPTARPTAGHPRRRVAVLALAAVVAVVAVVAIIGLAPFLVGGDSSASPGAQAGTVGAAPPPRPLVIPSGEAGAGAGAATAVVIDAGQSVWEAVAPYAPENVSMHEWIASVLHVNDLDARAVPAGTLVRLP